MTNESYTGLELAVVGMACRFPGAPTVSQFWDNLEQGVESVQFFTNEEMELFSVKKEEYTHENYVKAGSYIENKDNFDAAFFGFRNEEASILDPQIRFLHECSWEAIQNSGIDTSINNNIGVYVGIGDNANWRAYNFLKGNSLVDAHTFGHLTNKDYAATLLSHKLNLTGPSLVVNTACSSSLVAIHLGSRALLMGECDAVLCGGVTLYSQPKSGYLYEEGGIFSNDGHCRTFSSDSSGTVFGEGVGMVVLKRLKDAISSKDHIYSVIKGSAINNDGNRKVGFMAPSVSGQVDCIRKALKTSKVDADSISFIEAHGTGTVLGDGIEIKALNEIFKTTEIKLGSVKSNIGHLDTASGVAGFIKASLSLKMKKMIPSIHFSAPNFELINSPHLTVIDKVINWHEESKMRAGVSSFGIGGTNAHLILEEPPITLSGEEKEIYLILFSAKSKSSLTGYINDFQKWMSVVPEKIADISYSLLTARNSFSIRKYIVSNLNNSSNENSQLADSAQNIFQNFFNPKVVFLFPGQGTEYNGMSAELYLKIPRYKEILDDVLSRIELLTGRDYRSTFQINNQYEFDTQDTEHAHFVLFASEFSLAKLLIENGVKPDILVGHSLGEFVVATLAEIFTLDDALHILKVRGSLMQEQPEGRMLSVNCSEDQISDFLTENVALSGINAKDLVTVSGKVIDIEKVKIALDEKSILYRELSVKSGFHSHLIDPVMDKFLEAFSKIEFGKPIYDIVSTYYGRPLLENEMCSAHYWVNQLRKPVLFSSATEHISVNDETLCIEIGIGNVLSTLLKRSQNSTGKIKSVNLCKSNSSTKADYETFLNAMGAIWENSIDINFSFLFSNENRKKVVLPNYCFDKKQFKSEVDLRNLNSPTIESDFVEEDEHKPAVNYNWRHEIRTEYKKPTTDTEKKIAVEWERFFGKVDIGISDYFYDLEGDSLRGMTMLANLEKIFNVKLSIRDFLNEPTIENIALKIDNILWVSAQKEIKSAENNQMIL